MFVSVWWSAHSGSSACPVRLARSLAHRLWMCISQGRGAGRGLLFCALACARVLARGCFSAPWPAPTCAPGRGRGVCGLAPPSVVPGRGTGRGRALRGVGRASPPVHGHGLPPWGGSERCVRPPATRLPSWHDGGGATAVAAIRRPATLLPPRTFRRGQAAASAEDSTKAVQPQKAAAPPGTAGCGRARPRRVRPCWLAAPCLGLRVCRVAAAPVSLRVWGRSLLAGSLSVQPLCWLSSLGVESGAPLTARYEASYCAPLSGTRPLGAARRRWWLWVAIAAAVGGLPCAPGLAALWCAVRLGPVGFHRALACCAPRGGRAGVGLPGSCGRTAAPVRGRLAFLGLVP